ncbi:MAG: GNAT family N-acetyltransferase [Kofleriaceae bacterium]|nr:GNAT family N-acetyltransferase [Kofleriaceae bacterium]MBP9171902.1 GNAT family N-acetyltransferase [Kofleriaceae bacterium]MBP9859276.1 GNAT family N-acetyltransferase [Kofleriaceae bacterium]
MVALPRPSSSRPGLVAPAQIRRAHRLDHAWLGEVGTRAFAHLGDYHEVLPAWLAQANVAAWIDDPTPRRGFTMIAFYRDDRSGAQVADLLAITVEPPWRGHGLGRALLRHAIGVARAAASAAQLLELRLCVAEDNLGAQAMYLRAGFQPVEQDVGRYAAGQRALRMALPLR